MEKVKMIVPNKSYDGFYGGVRFTKGEGVFTDVAKAKELSKRYGYEIVELDKPKTEEVKEEKAEEKPKPAPKKRTRKKAEPKAGE